MTENELKECREIMDRHVRNTGISGEMVVQAQAADLKLLFVWSEGKVICIVKDTGAADQTREFPSLTSEEREKDMHAVVLTPKEAAATMALFVGSDDLGDEVLTAALYGACEHVWNAVPNRFRPIP